MRMMTAIMAAAVLSACSGPLCGNVGKARYCEGEPCSPENSGFCASSDSMLKCVGGHAVAYSCDVCSTTNSNGDVFCSGLKPY